MTSSIHRMKEFKEFLIKRNPSKKFADKYATYLTSNVIKNNAMSLYGTKSILDIDDVVKLNKVYLAVKFDAANIRHYVIEVRKILVFFIVFCIFSAHCLPHHSEISTFAISYVHIAHENEYHSTRIHLDYRNPSTRPPCTVERT